MTIADPGPFPRWADVPPVSPPTTVVEPTEAEKDVGWQPGKQFHVVDISIDAVANTQLYRVTIANLNVDYTSDGSAVDTEIRDGLIAAKNALGALDTVCTAAINGTNKVRLTAFKAGIAIPITEADSRLSLITVTPNKSDKPIRQFMNWLHNLAYLWIRFLASVRFRWSDVGTDFFVPGGWTTPTTGATLIGTSGAALIYIQGRRVSGLNVAKTYPDNSDTFVDLNRDGDFIYASAGNGGVAGAGAVPVLTANSLRCFRLSTVAGARTVSTFLGEGALGLNVEAMADVTKRWRFRDMIELGRGILATPLIARIRTLFDSGVSGGFNLISESVDSAQGIIIRVYDAAGLRVRTVNAKWVTSEWQKDTANESTKESLSAFGFLVSRHTPTTGPWADSAWKQIVAVTDRVAFGEGFLDTNADCDLPRIKLKVSELAGDQVTNLLESIDSTPGSNSWRWFFDHNTGRMWRCINVTYTNANRAGNTEWARVAAGDSFRFGEGPDGFLIQKHAAGSASPWAEASWVDIFSISASGLVGAVDLSVAGEATVTGQVNAPNAPKFIGRLATDGAGNITVTREAGALSITGAVFFGGSNTSIDITFDSALPTDPIVLWSFYTPLEDTLTASNVLRLTSVAATNLDASNDRLRIAIY